ncbi:MAG: SLC13 family permease [Devosiaceae bacterium]|nr:SLC13 family permease [Devosiaceae bacterium MH13]
MLGLEVWIVYAVVGAAIVAYASDRWSIEFVSLGVMAALVVVFSALPMLAPTLSAMGLPIGDGFANPEPDVAFLLTGFASPVLFTILALLVIGQGLYQTNALAPVAALAKRVGGKREGLALLFLIVLAGAASGFLNNTPVVVMLLPVFGAMAARLPGGVRPYLIPLSFATILGGTTTLIGSSTNLLVASTAERASGYMLGFFDQTPLALLLIVAALPYVLWALPRALREDTGEGAGFTFRGKQFIAEQVLVAGHPLVGAKAQHGLFTGLKDITVRSVRRGPQLFLPPFDSLELQPGDTVVLAAKRDELVNAYVASAAGSGEDEKRRVLSVHASEAMLAPGSRFVGQSIDVISAYLGAGHRLLGVERRARMPRVALDALRLEAGDVFLLASSDDAFEALRGQRDLLVLEETRSEIGNTARAPVALGLFGLAIALVILGAADLMVATVAAAFAMVATGCLNIRQATRAVDPRIVMMIGTALAMGTALQATGGDTAIASGVVALAADAGPVAILSAFFLVVAILTNILSNNATAVLFTPIALELATDLALPPEPFIMAVILAANCSFATPIGYQTNLLVMGPGHYQFSDYFKAGAPLVFIYWLCFTLLAPWYFGL